MPYSWEVKKIGFGGKGLEGRILRTRFINPLTTSVPHYIETSQLICMENQLTGFYMMGSIGR